MNRRSTAPAEAVVVPRDRGLTRQILSPHSFSVVPINLLLISLALFGAVPCVIVDVVGISRPLWRARHVPAGLFIHEAAGDEFAEAPLIPAVFFVEVVTRNAEAVSAITELCALVKFGGPVVFASFALAHGSVLSSGLLRRDVCRNVTATGHDLTWLGLAWLMQRRGGRL